MAITTRLDNIIAYADADQDIQYGQWEDQRRILGAIERFVGGTDTGQEGQFEHFVRRMISDDDSMRNRVDDALWTIADYLLVIKDALEPDPDSEPDDLRAYDPGDLPQSLHENLGAEMSNRGFALPGIDQYSDSGAVPQWSFSLSVPAFGGILPPTLEFDVDWSPFVPIRPLVHATIYILVALQCLLLLWEEFRRYG